MELTLFRLCNIFTLGTVITHLGGLNSVVVANTPDKAWVIVQNRTSNFENLKCIEVAGMQGTMKAVSMGEKIVGIRAGGRVVVAEGIEEKMVSDLKATRLE